LVSDALPDGGELRVDAIFSLWLFFFRRPCFSAAVVSVVESGREAYVRLEKIVRGGGSGL
jgi:hypothetical protein